MPTGSLGLMHPWTLQAHYNIPWGRQESPICLRTNPIHVTTGTVGFHSNPVSAALPQICRRKIIIWEYWLLLCKMESQYIKVSFTKRKKRSTCHKPLSSLCPTLQTMLQSNAHPFPYQIEDKRVVRYAIPAKSLHVRISFWFTSDATSRVYYSRG